MSALRNMKRRTAGRSGGIFQILKDEGGTPNYQYEQGHNRSDGLDSSTSPDGLDQLNNLNTGVEQDDNDFSSPRNETAYLTATYQGHDEDDDQREDVLPSQDQPKPRTLVTEVPALTTGSNNSRRWSDKITSRARRVRSEFVNKLSNLRLSTTSRETNDMPYTIAIDGISDDEDSSEEDLPENYLPRSRAYHDLFVDNLFPQNYNDAMFTEGDVSHAAANFEFFCSFPDIDVESVHGHSAGNVGYLQTTRRDMRNHYEVLGLDWNCDNKMIASRARRLMATLHPDKPSNRTVEQKYADTQEVARISLAKTELLSNELREMHDQEILFGSWTGVPYTLNH